MNLVVSLHDVHPGSFADVAKQRDELRAIGVRRLSLLVVPNWHGREPIEADARFIAALSSWRDEGDEIVLHGWTHTITGLAERRQDLFWTRLYTQREAEFLLVSQDEARVRLVTGRALLEKLGWSPVGFIAPAWLMAPHVTATLRELGFAYTTTRTEVIPLSHSSGPVPSPSLCYSTRAMWRRLASRVWNPWLARSQRHSSLVRVSLHPGDIAYAPLWRQIKRLVSQGIAAGRSPTTYRDFISRSGRMLPGTGFPPGAVRSSSPAA